MNYHWPDWEPIPFQYFTEIVENKRGGGTNREWFCFYVGWWLARRFYWLIDLGEWAARQQTKVIDWAERAS